MSYSGTLLETFAGKYENTHGIKVRTQKGEFKFFGRGPEPKGLVGREISFDAKKSDNGKAWYYRNIKGVGGAAQSSPQKMSQPGDKDPRIIFITGVVGRAMGSGAFAVTDIKALSLAAAQAYDALGGAAEGPSAPPPEGEDQYGAALDDEIPF